MNNFARGILTLFNFARRLFSQSAVIFYGVLAVVIGLTACDQITRSSPQNPQKPTPSVASPPSMERSRTLLIRAIAEPPVWELEAVRHEDQAQILRDLLEGLLIYDENGKPVAGVAESWTTKDNKIWHFTLAEAARWSNGEAVKATDFVQAWQALAQSTSPLKSYLAYLNLVHAEAVLNGELPPQKLGIHAENDRTLRLELDKPTPYLPAMLTHISLLPRYVGNDGGKKPAENANKHPDGGNEPFVGNGAYRLQRRSEQQIELDKNPFYRQPTKAAFTQVHYRHSQEKLEGKKAEENTDLALDAALLPPDRYHDTNNIVMLLSTLCSYFYEFNFRDPQLSQSAVRKAVVSLISAKPLTAHQPDALPTTRFLPPPLQTEQEMPWDPVPAESLLEPLGINEQQPLKLRVTADDAQPHSLIARGIERQLSQSDMLRIHRILLPWQDLQQARQQGDFQLIRAGWCADFHDPMAFFSLFYSHSPDNRSGYRNEEFDRLFEQALAATTEKVRSDLHLKLQQHIRQAQLLLPIFHYRKPIYAHPSLMGIRRHNAAGVIYSKDLWRKPSAAPATTPP